MKGPEHDDEDVLRAIATCGARALMIGRRALVMLGAPVLTSDYDVWIHIDDIDTMNTAFAELGLFASKTPAEARTTGRYVFENDIRVDVLVARSGSTPDGVRLDFETAWERRQTLDAGKGITVALPCIDDLITTKRWGSRPKDMVDIQWPGSGEEVTVTEQGNQDPWDEALRPDEFDRLVRRAIDDLDGPEGEEMLAHMAWFKRRYPTPLDRLRYSTRKYREWTKTRGILKNPR